MKTDSTGSSTFNNVRVIGRHSKKHCIYDFVDGGHIRAQGETSVLYERGTAGVIVGVLKNDFHRYPPPVTGELLARFGPSDVVPVRIYHVLTAYLVDCCRVHGRGAGRTPIPRTVIKRRRRPSRTAPGSCWRTATTGLMGRDREEH